LGESAVLLTWPSGPDAPALARRVRAVWEAVLTEAIAGVVDVVPAPASLLVRFDPNVVRRPQLEKALRARLAGPQPSPSAPRSHVIDVDYDGPDLAEVAAQLSVKPKAVVELHAAPAYTVLATGFSPGFVYLGPLAPELRLPRRAVPRARIPAGSVAIAERMTGVYGVESPGGWWLLGRTAASTFDVSADPPTPFAIGDEVTFRVLP
jgi:KipI family sensor histidine kinase inhibitor